MEGGASGEYWITGLPVNELWIAIALYITLAICTVYLMGQACSIFDFVQNNKMKSGLIQENEWAEPTKYYTTIGGGEITNKLDIDKETDAQITTRADIKYK